MKQSDVLNFKKTEGQIDSLLIEMKALSMKKPDDAVNKFKIKFINQVLEEANNLLEKKYKPFNDFATFDEDTIPSNSDIVLMLSQYQQCLSQQRADNFRLFNIFGID